MEEEKEKEKEDENREGLFQGSEGVGGGWQRNLEEGL